MSNGSPQGYPLENPSERVPRNGLSRPRRGLGRGAGEFPGFSAFRSPHKGPGPQIAGGKNSKYFSRGLWAWALGPGPVPRVLGLGPGPVPRVLGPGFWALILCPGSWALGLGPGPVPRVLGPGPGPWSCAQGPGSGPRALVLGPGPAPVPRVLGPWPGPWSCA